MDLDTNLRIVLFRHWMTSYQRPAGGACAIYIEFVVAMPCFQDR